MVIDLRSDTVTKPSSAMLKEMFSADVGDDVYGEDATVNKLQEQVAAIFKKEAGLFVPSGTMSNQLAIKISTNPGDEVILEKDSHIFVFETAAPSIISNVQVRTLSSVSGEIPMSYIEDAIRPDVYFFPKTKLICLENTHNRHGGTIISLDYIQSIYKLLHHYHIPMHLDGARIWNAYVANGIELHTYSEYFETISVCLSKGLGSPVGSVLVGSKQKIEQART